MLVDRLTLGMLALGITGIVWLAWPASETARVSYDGWQADGVLIEDGPCTGPAIRVTCSTNGGLPEAMQGPFSDLSEAIGGELDVKTMAGVAPFQQLTVVHSGVGTPDLTNHDRLVLVLQVGGGWFTHELASIGPFCGGTGSPTWVDAEAAAPRIVDGAVSVRAHETYRQGDSERSSDSLVECRLEP